MANNNFNINILSSSSSSNSLFCFLFLVVVHPAMRAYVRASCVHAVRSSSRISSGGEDGATVVSGDQNTFIVSGLVV